MRFIMATLPVPTQPAWEHLSEADRSFVAAVRFAMSKSGAVFNEKRLRILERIYERALAGTCINTNKQEVQDGA